MVANDNMQSHRGMLASNTREFSFRDVESNILLAACIFCTGCYAKFLGVETCHRVPNNILSECPFPIQLACFTCMIYCILYTVYYYTTSVDFGLGQPGHRSTV
jgi:hypothetical protein